MKNFILTIIVVFAFITVSSGLCFAQISIDKLKTQIEKIGKGEDITVIRLDGREFYGSIISIESDSLEIYDVDAKQDASFKYIDLKKVKKGYGSKGFGGKRVPRSRSLLIGAAIFGTLFTILIVALSKDR